MFQRALSGSGGGGKFDGGTVALSSSNDTTISLSFEPKYISVITTGGTKTCAYVWSSDKDSTKMWGIENTSAINGEQVASYYREGQIIVTGGNQFKIARSDSSRGFGTSAIWAAWG